jgi:hypothetical protein
MSRKFVKNMSEEELEERRIKRNEYCVEYRKNHPKPKKETSKEEKRQNAEKQRKWRENNLEKYRKQSRERMQRNRDEKTEYAKKQKELKRSQSYREKSNIAMRTASQRERCNRDMAVYRSKPENKIKQSARNAINNAIIHGRIIRPEICQICGRKPPRARNGQSQIRADHWHGYDKEHWLDVQFICTTCDGEMERSRKSLKEI